MGISNLVQTFATLNSIIFFNLQPENIKSLCSRIVDTLKRECPQLVDEGEAVAKKYQQLFSLFSICHFKYSGTDP